MRFGCFLPQTLEDNKFAKISGLARTCEELGFSSVWLFDHFTTFPNVTEKPLFECWTTLSALTQCTSRIRLGTLVTCNSFRHPSLLCKMASTLDAISDGRLDLGIGAGWFEDEYRRFGYDFSTTGSRIAQLAEALEIIKGIWTFPKFTYEGKFYAVQDAFCAPKPIQKPHPPIWVGGKGEKMLRLVVKYGDACNFSSLSPSECSALLTKLANYAQEAGRNLGRLTKSYMALVFYAADSDSAKSKIPKYLADLPTSVVDSTIGESFFQRRIVGGPDECIRRIQEYEAAGIDYLQLYFPDLSEELLSSFAEEVTESF